MEKRQLYFTNEIILPPEFDSNENIEIINPFNKIEPYKDENPLIINDNPQKLADFLKYLSLTHICYHHYTTLEVLEKILNTKTFKMTKGASKKLNDLHEIDNKGDNRRWARTYITCFGYSGEESINYTSNEGANFTGEENMAMWGMYGKPKTDAVRISFPRQTFFELVNKASVKVKPDDTNNINVGFIEKIHPTDVFYAKGSEIDSALEFQTHIDKKIEFELNDNECNSENSKQDNRLFKFLKNFEFTGCVKNYAWHYENEVRIIATINKNCHEILQNDAIFLKFPEELLKTFVITTGPNFTKNKELAKILKDYKIIPQPSVLSGNLNFKDDYGDIGETVVDLVGKIKKLTDK